MCVYKYITENTRVHKRCRHSLITQQTLMHWGFVLTPVLIAALMHALWSRWQFMIKPVLTGGWVTYQQGGFLLRLLQGQLSRTNNTAHVLEGFIPVSATADLPLCERELELNLLCAWKHSTNMVSTQPLYTVCVARHTGLLTASHICWNVVISQSKNSPR